MALLTQRGAPAVAISWTLRSLAIRLRLRLPEARLDVLWLRRQQAMLGAERFEAVVREHLDEDDARAVFDLLAKTPDEPK